MIIKKYQARNEADAIILAKEELGNDAIIMNVKKITPKGLGKLFKKSKVEVTAGPILSIKAAFEAGIERSASKNKKLCRYIPTQPIIIRILRSRQGTIMAFLPLAKYRKENKIAATK